MTVQNGKELWKSDGTASGTVMVKDIHSGPNPMYLTAVGDTLYFRAYDATHDYELWKSDGTASGTVMVKDINPSGASLSSENLRAIGNTLFFSANDGTNGVELWKSDGTASGTVMVQDLNPQSSNPYWFARINTTIYFTALHAHSPGNGGLELWALDPANLVLNTPPPVSWETHPALPAGMSISGGTISGTPSVYAKNQTYTIYANQSGYSTTHELYFSVDTDNAHTVVENQTIDPIGFHPPFNNGTTNWTVSPALPADLVMDPNTGEITGSVNGVLANTTYTVTATHGSSGSGSGSGGSGSGGSGSGGSGSGSGSSIASAANKLTLAEYHTCAIDANDSLICWGVDDYGQLGNGGDYVDSINNQSSRVSVPSSLS